MFMILSSGLKSYFQPRFQPLLWKRSDLRPDKKLDEIIAHASLAKDKYTECEAENDNHRMVKFSRKTRTMQMMDDLVDQLSQYKLWVFEIYFWILCLKVMSTLLQGSVVVTDGPDWMRQFLHPLAFKFGLKERALLSHNFRETKTKT